MQRNRAGPKSPNPLPQHSTLLKTIPHAAGKNTVLSMAITWQILATDSQMIATWEIAITGETRVQEEFLYCNFLYCKGTKIVAWLNLYLIVIK